MTGTVDHIDIGDVISVAPEKRRQETVQGIEIWQRKERIPAEEFQAAARVARAVVQDRAAYAIGDARLKLLPCAGAPSNALAGDEANLWPALLERVQQRRDERGVVLSVPIKRRDQWRARGDHAGAHRRRLPARRGMLDLPQPGPLRLERVQRCFGCVSRAVVDVNEFEAPAAVQSRGD